MPSEVTRLASGHNCLARSTAVQMRGGERRIHELRGCSTVLDANGVARRVLAVIIFQQQPPADLYRVGNNVMTAEHPIRMDTKDGLQRWMVAGRIGQRHPERVFHVVNILLQEGGPFRLGDGMVTASLGHCGIPKAGVPMLYDLLLVFGARAPVGSERFAS